MRPHLVFTLLSFVFLYPVSFAASGPLPDVQSYFDLNGAAHATKSKELMANGYRIISLSSYGTPPNNKYAAVTWLRWWKLMGYVPRFVSAVGPGGSGARFAAVMEKGFGGKVKHWCNVAKPGDVHWANDTSYVD
ncbi:hypothetical protein LZ32DRAFT_623544 [Colletotrichum eremochloae]|nr:hypothetical protein LZ32DRAFT_623544 [Colletotrichum eremochloae]